MADSRLSLALEEGLFALPDTGEIAVWGAVADDDLSALPQGRVTVIQAMKPEAEALEAQGIRAAVAAPAGPVLSVVFLPRSKALGRAWVAEAASVTRGPVVIDGTKTHGIEGVLREARKLADLSPALSKFHGKIAVLAPGADLHAWADPGPRTVGDGFVTRLGVFSADGPDPGSAALSAALPATLGPRVADLGAGWGFLSRAILERDGVEHLDLVEADHTALLAARDNIDDPRAAFHWADATAFRAEDYDDIVMNPPFHASQKGDPGLGVAFIHAARGLLKRQGRLWLVANRHLPYEHALRAAFAEVEELPGPAAYKLYRAARPIRRRQR